MTVKLMVFTADKLIGVSDINMKDRVEKHEGFFGITVAQEYRGEGVGKLLMHYTLQEAEKELPDLRIVTLGVFGHNDLAMNMYKQFGFTEHGRLPQGIIHKGNYYDHIFMYKKIRD